LVEVQVTQQVKARLNGKEGLCSRRRGFRRKGGEKMTREARLRQEGWCRNTRALSFLLRAGEKLRRKKTTHLKRERQFGIKLKLQKRKDQTRGLGNTHLLPLFGGGPNLGQYTQGALKIGKSYKRAKNEKVKTPPRGGPHLKKPAQESDYQERGKGVWGTVIREGDIDGKRKQGEEVRILHSRLKARKRKKVS